ncbi:hypothetical protein PENTCL1PPCAC_13224, partial [Pristionchus entomophagus]
QISLALLLLQIGNIYAGKVTNGLIDTEFSQTCFYDKPVDIVLLLDGSGSVGDDSFASTINFALLFARRLNISDEGARLGVAQFSDEVRTEIELGQFNEPRQLEAAIERMSYAGGATLTGRALDHTLQHAFVGARGGNVPKIVVVLTDAQSQDSVLLPAQRLRDANITVYAIGVTNLVNAGELNEIAGHASRAFAVNSLETLDKPLVDSITLDMCATDFRPGEPEIICGPDHIGVRAATKQPFDGFVFVQDHFHDTECRAGAMDFDDSRLISLNIPFNKCNVHRYRSVEPRGIFVETTIVFMFHMTFMTQVDHMVKIQCFYMEADKNVSNDLEVSMIPTLFRDAIYEMPTCYYTLRKGSADGPELDYAQLGDEVYHRWECLERNAAYDVFGMLVHSCYVDNGHGDRVDVLDSKGCGLDPVLLETPDYADNLRLAFKPYHVFKYADKPVLQFQCQITLCIKYDGGCTGITPPQCAAPPTHNQLRKRAKRESADYRSSLIDKEEGVRHATLDVFTKAITILEKAPPPCSQSIIDGNTVTLITAFNVAIALCTAAIWGFALRTRHTHRRTTLIGA